MNLDKITLAYGTMFVLAMFLVYTSGYTILDTSVYAQTPVNDSNLTQTGNVTGANTSAIPYVLNVTNSSDTTSQAVNQVIQAVGGGQSTSLQEVLDAAGNGNTSNTTLEQVIDAASSALNNQSSNLSSGNTSNNTSTTVVPP
ncbi:MAG TPA: hypothetical protein VF248_06875 [Nitrososphaeraceae archaeon]|jgi:hypothetical protein